MSGPSFQRRISSINSFNPAGKLSRWFKQTILDQEDDMILEIIKATDRYHGKFKPVHYQMYHCCPKKIYDNFCLRLEARSLGPYLPITHELQYRILPLRKT